MASSSDLDLQDGYDTAIFVDDVNDYVCSICAGVIRDAVETACRHQFCYKCMKRCLQRAKQCPLCQQHVVEFAPALKQRELISQLLVRCQVHVECGHTAALARIRAHEDACPHRAVRCEMCGEEVVLRLMQQHRADFAAHYPQFLATATVSYQPFANDAACGL